MFIESGWYSIYLNSFKKYSKIILFGDTDMVLNLKRITEQAGFKVAYMVGLTEDEYVKSYMDLLYEDGDYFVWVVSMDKYRMVSRLLSEIGLTESVHYYAINRAGLKQNLDETFYLDVHLGYAPIVNSGYDGITVYGREDNTKKTLRIATLGGSTSDSLMYTWKSWSEILYEKLCEKYTYNNVIIYSGGVCGYNSAQELIKLQRDIFNLNPDIVISYSGCNDMMMENITPWTHEYQRQVYNVIERCGVDSIDGARMTGYSCGVKTNFTPSQTWLKHIRMMYSVCQEFNIRFFSMLQPVLREEQKLLVDSETLEVVIGDMDLLGSRYIGRKKFIDDLRDEVKDYEYITDLTQLFDGKEHVYIDSAHVTEEGNKIIAEKIYDIVFKDMNI